MERKEGGKGGEKMSRQCPLCIGWVSPRAFVMLYTDPLSKVATRLPSPAVFIFSFGLVSLPPVWFYFFFFFICDCRADYYQGGTDYLHKKTTKRQRKWDTAKILILIMMGEVGIHIVIKIYNCTYASSVSYPLKTGEKSNAFVTQDILWSQFWSIMEVSPDSRGVKGRWGGSGSDAAQRGGFRARLEGWSERPPLWRLACGANSRVNEEWC